MERDELLHDGHRQRLRQRVKDEGINSLEPHEVLEFLLYFAIPRQDVNELAHALLDCFGDIRNVMNAEADELMQVKGMGEYTAIWLNKIGGCIKTFRRIEEGIPIVSNVFEAVQSIFKMNVHPAAPCLMQICLSRESGILYRHILCNTGKWGEPKVFLDGLQNVFSTGAHFVILVLFTKSAPIVPSEYDLQSMKKYIVTLNAANCTLLDMILVRGNMYLSLCRDGCIPHQKMNKHSRQICEEYRTDLFAGKGHNRSPINLSWEENYERIEPV